jgi:thymidine phosphorylase
VIRPLAAPRAGTVASLGAIRVGNAAVHLGAGRRTKDDSVDHAVGVLCLKKRGDAVEQGEPLAEIHARDERTAEEAAAEVLAAYAIGDEPVPVQPVLLEALR